MNKLLAWAVLTLAILAGFTARAGSAERFVIELNDTIQKTYLVICRPSGLVLEAKKLGDVNFSSYEECIGSPEYKRFVKVWEGEKTKQEDRDKPMGVISKEANPITNERILAYVTNFEKYAKVKVDRSKLFFGKLHKAIGFCTYSTGEMVLDKEFWNSKNSEYDKETTVYHELGHCILRRPHNDSKSKLFKGETKPCVNSLMFSSALGYKDAYRCFHKNREYYMKELVNKKRTINLNINLYSYDKVNKKWKLTERKKNVIHGELVELGGYSCTLKKYKQKKSKYGYTTQRIMLECTKDYVNWISLWHKFYYYPNSDAWKEGYGSGTHRSSDIRFWDNITKNNYSIFVQAVIK